MLDPISQKLVCFSSTIGPVIDIRGLAWMYPRTNAIAMDILRLRQQAKSKEGAVFQADGNFVIEFYTPHLVIWESGTQHRGRQLYFDGQLLQMRDVNNRRSMEFHRQTPITSSLGDGVVVKQ